MASNTQILEIVGKVKWAKVFGFNRDTGDFHEETNGQTSLMVHPNKAGMKALKESGSQARPKIDDEDDLVYFKFKRPWETAYEWQCGAPKVFAADGSEWDVEEHGLIGNGSICIVTISVYKTSKGKGTRLESIQVIKHVKYESDGDGEGGGGYSYKPRDFTKKDIDLSEFGEDDDEQDEAPKPTRKKAPAKKSTSRRKSQDLDDEIPF